MESYNHVLSVVLSSDYFWFSSKAGGRIMPLRLWCGHVIYFSQR